MNYKITRMKRRTIAIVISDGVVNVKAPIDVSNDKIEKFVSEKSGWIEKKLAEYSDKISFLGDVVEYARVLYHGKKCDITVSEAVKRVKLVDGTVYMPVKYDADGKREKVLAAFFKREAMKELSSRLFELSKRTGLNYKTFGLTNAKRQWGNCDRQCNIRLNFRLVMLDGALSDYVIIHELAHTAHHDHSAAFWAEVSKFYPDYKNARKALKTYSVLTSLYR